MSTGDVEQFPVTDVERDTALAALVRATGVGQLSLEEFDRRTDLVLTTSSRTEFAAATGGLEVIPPAEPNDAGSSRSATASCGDDSSWPNAPAPSW